MDDGRNYDRAARGHGIYEGRFGGRGTRVPSWPSLTTNSSDGTDTRGTAGAGSAESQEMRQQTGGAIRLPFKTPISPNLGTCEVHPISLPSSLRRALLLGHCHEEFLRLLVPKTSHNQPQPMSPNPRLPARELRRLVGQGDRRGST